MGMQGMNDVASRDVSKSAGTKSSKVNVSKTSKSEGLGLGKAAPSAGPAIEGFGSGHSSTVKDQAGAAAPTGGEKGAPRGFQSGLMNGKI